MHRISVIIPCYNHGQFLLETVESVKPLKENGIAEVIIVNDGSTDRHTIETLNQLEKENWKIVNQENLGLAEARNNGIRASSGQYILPLDSDNIIVPSFVEEAIRILNADSSTEIVYPDCLHFGEANFEKSVGEFDPCKLINDNYIDACAIYRREVWDKVGGYDRNLLSGHEDWDFWIGAIMKEMKFYYLPTVGFHYRVRKGSMLSKLTDEKGGENRIYIYSKYNYQLLKSIQLNYSGDSEKFKAKYFRQIESLNNKRLKNMIKLLIGKRFG